MGVGFITQGNDKSQAGPLLTAMESFGSGVQQGLTDVKNAVTSYNTSQAQEVLDAFDTQFCTAAKLTAASENPLNFTGLLSHVHLF